MTSRQVGMSSGAMKKQYAIQSPARCTKRRYNYRPNNFKAIGNPWIFTPHEPSKAELFATIFQHVRLLITCDLRFEEASQKIKDYYFPQPSLEDLEQLQNQISRKRSE